jgi:DNA-binding transcriptional LysR family regulator
VDLAGLDLNLLVPLRALLEERNVTRAGRQVGLSQPAMSAALARLRRHFGDDLLRREGNAYALTPLGAALLGPTATACDVLERVFTAQAGFDAETEQREFTLLASDYGIAVYGVPLAKALHELAPGVRLTFEQITVESVEAAAEALARTDGMLLPHGVLTGFPAVELFDDQWVCLAADGHPDIGDRLTMPDLGRLPWAVYQRPYDAPVARQLAMLGVEPRVEVSVPSFHLLPAMIEGTTRIAMIQARLARTLTGRGVRVFPCPFEAVPVREALWWHPLHARDAGHQWLRRTAAQVGIDVAATA